MVKVKVNPHCRQMRILHGDGFKLKEREEARDTVVSNLVICIYLIISQLELHKKVTTDLDEESLVLLRLAVRLLPKLSVSEEREITQYVFDLMKVDDEEDHDEDQDDSKLSLLKKIWSNYKFRNTLGSLTLFKLPDSALYFLSHFDRIISDDFTPTSEDIIRMRRATTGIQVRL